MICLWVAHWHYTVGCKWRSIGHTLNLKWRKIVAVERTERKWSSFNEFPCHGTAKCLFNLCSFTHPRTMWMKESLIHTGQCYAIRLFFCCVCVHLECALVASFGGGGDDGGRSVASTIPSIKMLDVQTLWSNDIVECQMVANSHKFKRFYLVDSTLNIIQLAIFSSANEFVVSFLQCI